MSTTYVFVPGSNSNSFSYAPLLRELALLGRRALAVDLPGHGYAATVPLAYHAQDAAALATAPTGLAGASHEDAVAHVVDVVRRAAEHGPVVLVGHSRGGFTVTSVANRVPELLSRVVYVSAWCCVDLSPAGYMAQPEYASSALHDTAGVLAADPVALGALRMNWRTSDPALLAALTTALDADGTESEVLISLGLLEPDEGLDVGADRVEAATWGRVPHTYVRLARDRSLPPELQDRFIREADALTPDNPFDVRTLDSSHVGFLVRPEEAARLFAALD
ncbi:alpha/beta hydrolase [Saccharothrix longispora]|uniref:alpha/beta hydrolase n=1 Tax=Saccharothrix longispora TaxID=33920 RepID=UPI0028FD04B5|nr:alpha/beta hydrolase [Saccharothrix longispora]MBY8848216.1 alpha/beta hydrolase [Saccharothrix sp. MB29]MDU0288007.1 alpha/beta hydrolase [Saccharothrix longispora]